MMFTHPIYLEKIGRGEVIIPMEVTPKYDIFDEYGKPLMKGQSVAVAVTDSIVLRGIVKKVDPYKKQVTVEVTWPAGNKNDFVCTHYGRRDLKIMMSQIVVL